MSETLALWWLTTAGNRARKEWLAAHDDPPPLLVALTADPMQPAIDALERWLKANVLIPSPDQDTTSTEGHPGKP